MSEQLEFPFIHTAKQRKKLLQDVQFGSRRNRTLLAALLHEVSNYPPGNCYLSQGSLAAMFKCSRKTIQRALETLSEMDLIVTQLRSRVMPDGISRTLNHYFINWTALEQAVNSQTRGADVALALGQLGDAPLSVQNNRTDATVAGYRCDSLARPMRQLRGTDATVSCPAIEPHIEKTTTVELVDVVFSCGVKRADEAVAKARSFGLSSEAVLAIVRDWKDLPEEKCLPGTLYNWLTTPGPHKPPSKTFRLKQGLEPAQERKRAELIRYGKTRRWTHEQIQHAIQRLEHEMGSEVSEWIDRTKTYQRPTAGGYDVHLTTTDEIATETPAGGNHD